ncbi:MAG TPA: T9SS type A sorting domain-containing protein, partial [Bacteroidia bacterium]|nr:T9SS type A sorting domain-containing protein [Bacteroidia bacterium]
WSNGKTSKTIGGLTIGTTYTATVTDANGCTVSGSILFTGNRLGDNVTSFTANLYPNPTQDVVTLSLFNCPLKHATIEIKNMMGAVVLKQKLLVHNENQSILIETINFDQGVYDVSILIDDKILNQRLIIQR